MDLVKKIQDLSKVHCFNGITFISSEQNEKYVSYQDLYHRALAVLHDLQAQGMKPKQELVFQIEDNETFIYVFWACILGGIIPVPVTPSANDELRNKVLKIWNTCHRPYLISDRKSFSSFETFLSEKKIDSAPLHDIKDHTLLIENLTYSSSEASIYCPKPTDIAFIQFSSGSTGDPKGVVLTHENLVTNIQAIEKGMNMQENDATLSWMPLTHDMGLIGFHILPVLANKQQYLMPTSLFVRRPNLWLSKVQQHQATLTSSPNFGYQHFLQHFKPENASNWDLSHLRLIFNGAEPISASLCHEFLDEMEKYGLNRGVMFTVYGMAEASLAVTFPPPGQEFSTVYLQRDHLNTGQEIIEVPEKDDRTVTFVDVGYPVNDCLIRICDENQQEVEEKIIGNIQIKGKNVTSGYYNNVAASQKAITADGWLDTGDLGFLKEGRLVITGRSKDIIFVNGQNYYAHDLERVAATVPGIDPSKIVACGVSERDTQKEVVVLFVMFRKEISKYLELYEMIKKTMLYKIGIMVHEVIPIKSIPKTTSGKVQRYKLAEQYACDEFAETIAELHKQLEIQAETKVVERPETDIEIKLVQICREILGVNEIGVQDGFLDLGGHSLKMMELISRVHEELSVELTVKDIFDSLTIKELAKKIEHAEESGASAILPVEEQEIYPVSSAQKRIYLLTQLEESERSYHIPIILSVEGRVDYKRLEESFTKLIHRHEILRTSFDSLDGKPISKVHDSIQFKLTYLKGKTNVEEIMNQFIQPFDLRQAPLFRVGIIQVAEAKHFLVLDMHHIISDGTSMNLFIQEFASLYKGEEVPAIQLQYKDFVNWQNDRLLTPEMNKQKEYWLQNLSGELPVLAMPTDFSRPVTQSFEGNSLVFRLDRTSTEKLYQLATNTGTTLYMVLLAAYNIVLSKYTGQEDLIVGSPIAGRTHNSLHHMIGMFVNSLAMRNFPQSTKSVRQFIHEVKGTAISAYANQDYPFDELLDHLYLRRDVSRNPVFDTMFVLQNMEITEPEVEELTFALQDFQDNVSRFDFSLFSQEITDGIHFTLEYATKLFKEETMLRFFQHYLKVLEQIVEEPDQKLSEIELLSELEREELLYTFNHTKHDYPSDLSLAERFAEQVAHTPEQIAIVFEDRKLTYQEVNEKANLVAKHLQLHGVRPNHPVGIMADRNPETIIGILGIIKAGGAYLPLSPDYPVDRMKYMLEDAGVSLLLTQEQREEFLAFEGESLNLQELLYSSESGEEGEATAKKTSGILEPIASTAEDLAYVIYTSGSTGQPKGVMATQRGVMRLVCNPDYVELKEGDSLLQTGALVFDASTFEIWGALLNGLTLVLVQDEVILDVELLEAAIKRHGVSTMWLTSPLFNQLSQKKPSLFQPLKQLIVGGDVLSPPHIEAVRKECPDLRLINGYGPTENTTFSCCYTIEGEIKGSSIPIGRPIANSTAYVLNQENKLQPILVAGELCVGGAGVAKGYINQPELTAEKFIDHPFCKGEKLYRTGDLARWLPNGTLEYLGRMDQQVKIRGYRIEPGEIQNHLVQLEGIEEAFVTVREGQDGDKVLCAYFSATESKDLTELRGQLMKDLPPYMIPSYFVQVERLPLTPNGKVNRTALPEPSGANQSGTKFVAPRNEVEEMLVKIWREVLQLDRKTKSEEPRISVLDHFFELGGHSLKAMELLNRIKQSFHVHLPLPEVFKDPTIQGMAKRIQQGQKIDHAPIPSLEKKEYYPVSFSQKRMYLLSQFDQQQIHYNMPGVLLLEGKVDIERLEKAFNLLIERHEGLRTTFKMIDQEVVQIINEKVDFKLHDPSRNLEVYQTTVRTQEPTIEEMMKDFVQPFDLQQAPLLRARIIQQGDEKCFLLFDMHHIISDGLSIEMMMKEIAAFYKGESLPELAIHYKDFAAWQVNQFTSDPFQQQEKYWLTSLQGELPILNMPTDYPRPAIQSHEGSSVTLHFPFSEVERLNRLAQETGCTLYMILLSAYNILLHKYTGQEDIIVGSPISGRQQVDIESLIGMFVNTLALRNFPVRQKGYKEFLLEVRNNVLMAFDHQEYPFDELVQRIDKARDASRHPIFDTMFALQNTAFQSIDLGDGRLKLYPYHSGITKFDLTLNGVIVDDGIRFTLEYSTKLFREDTMHRLLAHYLYVLKEIGSSPEKTIAEIELTSEEEKQQLLVSFNRTERRDDIVRPVHQLIEEQAQRTPDQLAVVFEDKTLTYQELNARANQIARVLQKKGLHSNDIVGIMVDHSLEMIVGVLGILKAGGAYLPIDPHYPTERINHMLTDSKVNLLLTQQQVDERASGIHSHIEKLNVEGSLFIQEETSNLEKEQSLDDLAYVIYTSGSTGKPKGVMIEHQGLHNLCKWHVRAFDVTEQDRSTKLAGFGFDASVWEIFPYLLTGATIHILAERIDVRSLHHYFEKHHITISFLPTPLCEQFLALENKSLRILLTGGDHLKTFRPQSYQLINNYGPTENTVVATSGVISGQGHLLPIGKPIDNTSIYILNADQQLQPIGVPGELCISGAGLARGYLHQPALTAEKFVQNPFEEGQRMYRTGDLARWLADGSIEYLGRMDDQVKVRGYRIELGEIEAQLLTFSEINKALVVMKQDQAGSSFLCAYYTVKEPIQSKSIREKLVEELPEFMIPSAFIELEEFPLTPNGKIDRQDLPEPLLESQSDTDYVAPQNDIQRKLVQIWQETLGLVKENEERMEEDLARIGVCDSFFTRGGDSLKAAVLISKIQKKFHVDLPIKEVFQYPTIEQLAGRIEKMKSKRFQPIVRAEEKISYSLSSAQKRLYFLSLLEGGESSYNLPGAMMIQGNLNHELFEQAFKEMLRRHEILRTSFEMENGEPVQKVHKEVDFKLGYLEADEEELERIMQDFVKPFELTEAPLLRVSIVQTDQNTSLLLFDMHHIISDGTSMSILIDEVAKLYQGEELPELRVQYKDYSEWQNQWIKTEQIKPQEQYWLSTLGEELPILNLPTDYPRPSTRTFEGERMALFLNELQVEKLHQLAQDSGATLYMVLLAGYNILLSKYTGQEDIIVGSPIAGRHHADIEQVLGMFVNTLAMRNYPSHQKTVLEFIHEVKEHAVEAFANQHYPFEKLIDQLKVQRDVSRHPIFDVMFVLQQNRPENIDLGSLTLTLYPINDRTSKFDLTLTVIETEKGLEVSLEYSTALFKKATMERMMQHYITVLEQMTGNEHTLLSEITPLTMEEQQQLLLQVQSTQVGYPREKTIHELFEEQVKVTPDHIAVSYEGQTLTYQVLNKQANQLARLLRKKGVKPDSLVGLMVNRSLDMVVAMLAILKAGGAYVPIDPEYPESRITSTLIDSHAELLITSREACPASVSESLHLDIIYYDHSSESLALEDAENLSPVNTAQDMAYVIYTSGSTGVPKGVSIEHRNVVRLLHNDKMPFDFTERDVWTMFHSMCFDFSVWEMYGALLYGGKLLIVSRDTAKNTGEFYKLVKAEKVTVLNQTPTAFYHFANEDLLQPNTELSLRYVIFGGEALQPIKLKAWMDNHPTVKLINMYGITETTVHVTYKEITSVEVESNVSNIGKPIPTLNAYIMDQNQKLVPIGVEGELYVGGEGVARGYLNRPELTTEKFIPNPYHSNEILYRSGDVVKMLPDGEMIYLGRVDHQVKIRGYRIELGEIENRLLMHPEISEALVLANEDQEGHKALCAYLVASREVEVSELRAFLIQDMPNYMVPSYFVTLDKMPMTSNGKIDRKALPEPAKLMMKGQSYLAPRNEVEERLKDIWEKVLGIENIGIENPFFELGGDSIKAIQVSARLFQEGYKVEIKDIFRYPTIAELSPHVRIVTRKIDQGPVEGEVPLTPIQSWFFEQNFTDQHHWNQSIMLYRQEGFDAEILHQVLQKIMEHHDSLRMVFEPQTDQIIAFNRGVASAEEYSLHVFDLRSQASTEEEIRRYIECEANQLQSAIQLETGPLVQVGLFQTEEGDHLLIVIHHLVVDGISWRILTEDLAMGYEQVLQGQSIVFPQKTDSYLSWSEQLVQYAQSAKVKQERAYWEELEQSIGSKLPKDFPTQEPSLLKEIEQVTVHLTLEQTELLLKEANKAYNTEINDLLLTSLGLAILEWSGIEEFMINLEGHGREKIVEELDISRTVGWFTSQYPVVLRMYQESLSDQIKRVKEGLHRVPNKGIGYSILKYLSLDKDDLLDEKNQEQSSIWSVIPEISFNYLGQFDAEMSNQFMKMSSYPRGNMMSLEGQAPYVLNINGLVVNKQLQMTIDYSTKEYRQETIENLSTLFHKHVAEVITHCVNKERVERTPSDMGYKNMSLEKFQALRDHIKSTIK